MNTMQKENEVFEEWYQEYFCDSPRQRAFTAWSRVIWLLYSGAFIPDNVYHPNQTLEDND